MTERAKHAARIRDQRQERGDIRRPSGSSKNTRKWCRGVVGRKHDAEWQRYVDVKHMTGALFYERAFGSWRVLICKNCGKEIETDYGQSKWLLKKS